MTDDQRGAPIAGPHGVRRLRVTTRSVLLLIGLLAVGIALRNVVGRSTRVLGWFVASAVVAGLLQPIVRALMRWMRRPFALLLVLVGLGAGIGVVSYGVVDNIRTETARLQKAAPEAAQRLEESERFGQAARDFGLKKRVEQFVDELPDQLAGGGAGSVVQSAASRSVAYLASVVLTVFLLLHGPRLAGRGLGQIHDPDRRNRYDRIARKAYRRWYRYIGFTLARAAIAGLLALLAASVADLPGPAVLGLFVGILAIVPVVGVLLGAIPVLLLAYAFSSGPGAVLLTALVVAYQLVDALVFGRWVDHHSLHVGPAVTVIIAMLGVNLAGIGGMFVGLALAVAAVAVADELAPEHEPSPATAG